MLTMFLQLIFHTLVQSVNARKQSANDVSWGPLPRSFSVIFHKDDSSDVQPCDGTRSSFLRRVIPSTQKYITNIFHIGVNSATDPLVPWIACITCISCQYKISKV
jgi:hypothetical protein